MIKIGMIGFSEGNGHPYSWSAIFNGYNENLMRSSGFPIISEYLSKESFPECQINNASVTDIYTEDIQKSRHIAKTCHIGNVSSNLEDLVSKVDAVILARDDAEKHFEMSKIILDRGIPILIDKPLAFNLGEAERIFKNEKYVGQIFSATGVRFSNIFRNVDNIIDEIGEIRLIKAESPKDWKKYSVHIIEPVITYFDNLEEINNYEVEINNYEVNVKIETNTKGIEFKTTNKLSGEISFELIGTKGSKKLVWNDTFNSFKSLLESFLLTVNEKKRLITKSTTLKVCEVIGFVKE